MNDFFYASEYLDRLEDQLTDIRDRMDGPTAEVVDEATEEWYEFGLSADIKTKLRIWITFGGPNVYVEAEVARDAQGIFWERVGGIQLFNSWAKGDGTALVPEGSNLADWFDGHVEAMPPK